MLLTKEVEVGIVHRNKNIYLQKGYKDSIVGNTILVKVEDLPISSGKMITISCDYCDGENYEIRYCDYTRIKCDFLNKDACKNCAHKKRMELTDYKITNNIETGGKSSRIGYWHNKSNIINEIKSYVERNGYIGLDINKEDENKKWHMLHWAMKKNNLELDDVLSEIGYNREQVQKRKPNGSIIPFEELKNKIEGFIEEFGAFPSQRQLSKDLKIHNRTYKAHGTLKEIREKLGYGDNKHLIDTRDFINSSSYELITANYLIAQDIPYKREQLPFKKFDESINYRSDFTFYIGDREIHVELWGGMKSFNSQRDYFNYDKIMDEKMRLYDLYNIELISINPEIFYYSMSKIKENLYDIFSNYLDLPFTKVTDRLVSTFRLHEMSDEKLLKEIMKYSDYENVLPSHTTLRKMKQEYLFVEVLKRYDSLDDFAKEVNMITAYEARSKKYKKITKVS